jgi:hypothetical protein
LGSLVSALSAIWCSGRLILPLLVLGEYFFPYIVPRNLFFRVWIEILLLLYAGLLVINKSYRPAKSRVVGAVLLYLAVMVLSSFTVSMPGKAVG